MVEIANALAKQGHRVDLLVLKPVGSLAEKVHNKIRVVSLDAGRIALSLFPLIMYLWREKPATLLALDEYSHLLSLLARMLSGVKTHIVLRIGNMLTELFMRYEGKSRLMPFLVRRLYKKADGIIANSKGVADDVLAVTGILRDRISVIHNPKFINHILALAAEPVTHAWLVQKTVPVVIAVGRLRIQKNFSLLIRAFATVSKNLPSRLIIVGGGREEPRLKALIQELRCEESVSLLGYADNPYAYMSKADIFASASLWEGMPNSLLEAIVCGLPVIASDCSSGPREILAPDTDYKKRLSRGVEQAKYGVLTAVNDEGALVEALRLFLGDEKLRTRYSEAAKERSKDFDSEKIMSEYKRVLGL